MPSPFLEALAINVTVLRQQQIRLGLLKAARVLFSRQENLRQIMARPVNTTESEYSLFQQLLSAATIPSPVKAMFGRDELEVMLFSYIYLMTFKFYFFRLLLYQCVSF